MKKIVAIASAAVALMGFGIAFAETVAPAPGEAGVAPVVKKQTTCPVMGGAVNKALYVDHAGKRIYVCCGGCIGTVKADPAKYIRKLEAEGVTLDAAEPAKPVTPPAAEPVPAPQPHH